MYHSTPYTNKEIRKLLGNLINRFVLSGIRGRPARIKHKIKIKDNKVFVFGSDFIAKGYLKK
jgi:hypothetical protein